MAGFAVNNLACDGLATADSQRSWHLQSMPKGLRRFGSCGRHVRAVTIDQGRTDGTIELRTQFVLTLLPSSVSDERHRLAPVLRCLMDKIDYPSFVRDRCTVPYRSAPGFAPPSARGNADTAAAEIDQIPEWFSQFLNDRQTRKPSAHTMKAYRQGFIAIATLVAGGDPSRLAVTDITKDTMRNAFAAYARDHEAASIRRWWSTWNVLCTFLYTGERLVANPMQLVGQPRLAKPLPKALPRTAVEALLEAVATDQDFKRQTDWAEPDLALILTALLAVLRAEELHQADVGDIRTTDDGAAVITSKAKAARSAACPSRPNCCRSSRHSSPAERSASPALQSAKRTSRLPPYRDGPHDPAVRRPRRRTYHPRNIAIANQTGLQAGRPRRSTGPRGPSPRAAAHLRHRTSRLGCQRLHPDEAARAPTKSTTSAKRPATQAVSSTPTAPKHSERCTACTRSRQSTHRAHPRPRRLQTPTHNHSKR